MPGSLVETRPLESLVLASQQPGQDSSDSHTTATSTNKCLFSTHQCTLVKEEKLPKSGWKEWHVSPCYTFCLFLSFLLLGSGCQIKHWGEMAACLCCWSLVKGSVCVCECQCVAVCVQLSLQGARIFISEAKNICGP